MLSRMESDSMSFSQGPSRSGNVTEEKHARAEDRYAARFVTLKEPNAKLDDDISGSDEEWLPDEEGPVPLRTQRKRDRRAHRNAGGQQHNTESSCVRTLPSTRWRGEPPSSIIDEDGWDPPSPYTGLRPNLGRESPYLGDDAEDTDDEYNDSDEEPIQQPTTEDDVFDSSPENLSPIAENEGSRFLPYLHPASISRPKQPKQPGHPTQPQHMEDEDITDRDPVNNGGLIQLQKAKDKTSCEPVRDTRPLEVRRSTSVGDESDSNSRSPNIHNSRRKASARPAASAIGGTMAASNIILQLVQHGCRDLTHGLNLPTCTQYPISTGGFGDIYRGELNDGTLVAIKCIRVFFASPAGGQKYMKHAAREIHTWSKCEHRHVLKLLGMVKFRGQIGMVSPWVARGSLNNYLAENPEMNRPQLCTQVADGLAYLHSCGIVHGDLKGANVLLSDDGDPLLTDFGNAILEGRTLQFTYTTTKTSLSLRWAAPELIRGESFSFEADVFALGMTILEIITGFVPYIGINDFGVMYAITQGRLPERPEDSIPIQSKHGDLLWSMLTRCWEREAQARPTPSAVRDQIRAIQPGDLLVISELVVRTSNLPSQDVLSEFRHAILVGSYRVSPTNRRSGGAVAPGTQVGPSSSPTQTRRISYAPGTQPVTAHVGAPATLAPPQQTGTMTPVMESVQEVMKNDQSFQPAQFTADDFTRAVAVATVSAFRHQQGQTGTMTPVMGSVQQVMKNDQSFQPAQFTADDFTRAVAVATVSALRHQQGQRRTAAAAEQEEAGHGGHDAPSWSRGVSASVLLGCTALYALIAEILVEEVDVVLEGSGIDEKFLGITLFALVPNTTEFMNAMSFALTGNIALSMETGSAYALQVCLLQIPAMVAFSAWWDLQKMGTNADTFTLIFPRWDVIAIILSIFLLTYTYIEAKSNYHRGSILILSYLVLMSGFYFAPPPTERDDLTDFRSMFREVFATSALSWNQYVQVWAQSLWIR